MEGAKYGEEGAVRKRLVSRTEGLPSGGPCVRAPPGCNLLQGPDSRSREKWSSGDGVSFRGCGKGRKPAESITMTVSNVVLFGAEAVGM